MKSNQNTAPNIIDYRSKIKNVLDKTSDKQSSLRLGLITIQKIINQAKQPIPTKPDIMVRSKTKIDNDPQLTEISTIEFNLKQKHVGVLVGDRLRTQLITKLVKEHNGKLTMIDAFKHANNSKFYRKQFKKHYDIIIMVQNQNKHSTSKALLIAAKKYHVNLAIANGLGIQQIERAIYRALNHYPAYESSANIEYPMKNLTNTKETKS